MPARGTATRTAAGMGAVVVTGASSGIGEATTHRLAALGLEVHAGVRSVEDADRLTTADGTGRVHPMVLDVTDGATIAAARATVESAAGPRGLVGLVNNAGIAVVGPLEVLPLDDWRRQLEVNVVGQVAVTQAFLPALRAARGRVVFTGSLAGRLALPGFGPYSASKHALEAVSDALRREVRPFGVRVSLLEPGSIATPIWAKGRADVPRVREGFGRLEEELYGGLVDAMAKESVRQERLGIPPERVAAAIEHALTSRRPRHRYVIGRDAQATVRFVRHLPSGVVDRAISRMLG